MMMLWGSLGSVSWRGVGLEGRRVIELMDGEGLFRRVREGSGL